MQRIILICLAVLFMVPALSQAGTIGPASIRFTAGDIMFRSPADEEWLPAVVNTPLDEGDALWCPEGSRLELQLPDGSMLRLDGGSLLDLLANEDGFVHLHLASGRLYLRTASTSGNDSLQIDADDTTVLPAARTRLRLDMRPNSQEDVAIFKGTAYVEGNSGRTKVRSGEQIVLEEGQSELLPLDPADEWELWNQERDNAQARTARGDSWLPAELRSHAAELDANGTWVRVPEYGMVWRPNDGRADEWAPYRRGQWLWKGDDYVWIASENWGWLPYHYGRWTVVRGRGWCWVPPAHDDVYWGPGYVGWYTAGNQIGWTPLAPGETFYGHRNYGRQSVNITTVNINTTTVVYQNRKNRGGLTMVQQNDFLRGRTIHQQPRRGASTPLAVSVGSPRIKPQRETRAPGSRQAPPGLAPPSSDSRDRRELRERFPRVNPEADRQRHSQQPAAVTTVPAAPSGQTPPLKGKRTDIQAPLPNNRPDFGTRPPAPPRQREENRQRPTAPLAEPAKSGALPQRTEQPARLTAPTSQPQSQQASPPRREENRQRPTSPQAEPAKSGTAPQRTEQPARLTAPMPQPQSQQADPPRREENRQRPMAPQAAPPVQPAAPQRPGQPRSGPVPAGAPAMTTPQSSGQQPKEQKPKKVWKVTTPENGSDKEKGKEPKDKEHK